MCPKHVEHIISEIKCIQWYLVGFSFLLYSYLITVYVNLHYFAPRFKYPLHLWHSYIRASQYNSKLQPRRCNVSLFIYFYRRSICFREFLRPSSGAHNCTYSFSYCQPILLLAGVVDEMEAAVLFDNTWSCMYSYVLLMMGGGTVWNMLSVCRNK
jgi:hypothetical protein